MILQFDKQKTLEDNQKICLWKINKDYKLMINDMSGSTWICRNLIIHASDNNLVIMEEFVFFYYLINRHYYLNTRETLQRSRAVKCGK